MGKQKDIPRPESISIKRKDIWFAAACLVLILLKYMLASQLPISPRPNYRTDDHLLVMMSRTMLAGRWLGNYGFGTLMKGSFYPMFLSVTHLSGIAYLSVLDLLNSAAALYFTLSLKRVLQKRRWMLILLAVLLFNPVNTAEWTFGRIYRCSITNFQTLFLFGSVIAAYLDEKDSFGRQLARALFCGLILWSAWNTREDAAWMLPFVLVAGIVMLVGRLKKQKEWKKIVCSAVLFMMPFLILLGGNGVITLINNHYYGLPIRNEASAGFGEMLKTMYSIKNKEHIDHVSVSAEKLERMYAVSPTLRLIEPELTESLLTADANSDLNLNDGEVEDGWFYWCVRRAVENSGIAKTLPEADAFYRQITKELKEAISDPANGFETQWVMPSALMSPWQPGYEKIFPGYILRAIKYTIKFDEVTADPRIVGSTAERMSYLFEGITGNVSIHNAEDMTIVGNYRQIYIDRANAVTSVYQAVNPYIAILSVVLFALQFILAIVRRRTEEVPWLLIVTGIALSVLVLLIGIAYTDMTAFIAIRYTYISGGYALMLACEWIAILRAVNSGYDFMKSKKGGIRWLGKKRSLPS